MGRPPSARLRRTWRLAVAFYAAFVLIAPFTHHHPLVCQVKTTFHCTSCASGVVGSHPHAPTILDGSHLADVGRALTAVPLARDFLLAARPSGRSPPAA